MKCQTIKTSSPRRPRWNQRRSPLAVAYFWLLTGFLSVGVVSSLVNGKIKVQATPPRGWVRYSDNDGACNNLSEDASSSEQSHSSDTQSSSANVTHQIYHMRPKRRIIQPTLDDASAEEKERRELEWIVKNTEKVLGPESPTLGEMSHNAIQLTCDLMSTWGRRASQREGSRAPHVVERLLKRLIKEQNAGNNRVKIDTSVYNIVLDGWSNSNEEGSAERSEEILLQMERMYLEEDNEGVKPNEASYNAVIKAYVKNGNRQIAATKAEALVNHMEENQSVLNVSPTRRSYNLLLYALANSNLENAATHAEDILHRMMKRYIEEDEGRCKPDINSYNQVLTAWARGKCIGFEDRMQSVYQELLNLPDEMGIHPNTDSFNAVMGGWLKSDHPGARDIIESVLETMEQNYASGNTCAKPDRVTINTLTAAYVKNGSVGAIEKSIDCVSAMERKYQIIPNTVSHNIVLDSWCKSGRVDAPGQVIDLIDNMEQAFRCGKENMKPDGYTYSSVIGCFVRFKRDDATEIAEEMLTRMKDLFHNFGGDPPPTSVYNAVINAWASSADPNAHLRVKELLLLMENNNGADPSIPKPNRITYNTVIKAMRDGKEKSAAYAEEILTALEGKGRKQSALLPDSYTYTSVITAYGRSDASNKAKKALEILKRMIGAREDGNLAAVPTTHSFNAVLNACAFVDGNKQIKNEAFEIAMQVYDMLQQHGTADHTTFGTLLRICATLLRPTDEQRERLVEEIFQNAAETGNVGRLVVKQLKFASTPQQYTRLMGRDPAERTNTKDLPRSWTRNVREMSRRVA